MGATFDTMRDYIGKLAYMPVTPKLSVQVRIKGVRFSYGRVHALVTPIKGKGSEWVWLEKLELRRGTIV